MCGKKVICLVAVTVIVLFSAWCQMAAAQGSTEYSHICRRVITPFGFKLDIGSCYRQKTYLNWAGPGLLNIVMSSDQTDFLRGLEAKYQTDKTAAENRLYKNLKGIDTKKPKMPITEKIEETNTGFNFNLGL